MVKKSKYDVPHKITRPNGYVETFEDWQIKLLILAKQYKELKESGKFDLYMKKSKEKSLSKAMKQKIKS